MKTLIVMSSITYAMRAKDMLSNKGIWCAITRTPRQSGCGYSLQIKGEDEEKVVSILKSANFMIRGVIKEK